MRNARVLIKLKYLEILLWCPMICRWTSKLGIIQTELHVQSFYHELHPKYLMCILAGPTTFATITNTSNMKSYMALELGSIHIIHTH